jgi:hypothetical protein
MASLGRYWRVTWKIIGLAVVVVGLSLWAGRLELFRLVAVRLLDRQGMGPTQMTVARLGWSGLEVRDVSLYGGALRAADVSMAYDPGRLSEGIVDRLEVGGLRVAMEVAGRQIRLGGVPLPRAGSSPGKSVLPRWRIDALKATDAKVVLVSPAGRVEATFSTDLALSDAGIRGASFAADISAPVAGATRVMRVRAPVLDLSAPDGDGLRLRLDNAGIKFVETPWLVDRLGGEVLWRGDRLLAKVTSGRVRDQRTPAVIVPVDVTGEAVLAGARLDFTLRAMAEAQGGKGRASVTAIGHHDSASGAGLLRVSAPPVMFRANGLQLKDFLPATARDLTGLGGSVGLSGAVSWQGTVLSPALVVRLAELAYEGKGVRLSNFHGDIRLAGLWPLATEPGQVLTGTVEAGGMPPADATLTFQLLPAPALHVQSMRMSGVGGQISASPMVIDPGRPDIRTTVSFRQIDLGQMVDFLGFEGLRGTGRLDGQVPLTISGGRVLVHDGRLEASGPGVLQLRSDALPKQVTDAGESMTLALRALEDFHYDTLTLELARGAAGDGTITLRLQGNNPAVLDGRAFNINIKLESNFDRLVDLALQSMTAARELLRGVEGSTRQ